ncbi:MAG: putative N6-adenine-specific methylase containing domain protein, partial [Myxococcales bacterium]|nr:putative N6-adenine-specific methylase containing domain protein [Myxococcales bacterium]
SFTPAQRDAPALVELIVAGADPTAGRAATAIAGLGDPGRLAIDARLGREIEEGAAARLVGALGLLAKRGDVVARAALLTRMTDRAVRVRRAAAIALGKLGGDDARAALIARWDASDVTPDERRALAEALGKVGGDEAIERLRSLRPAQDAELERRRDRAVLMADRSAKRDADSEIATDVKPPTPLHVRLHCKPGLAELLALELPRSLRPVVHDEGSVDVTLDQPWSALFASRLWSTAGISIALEPADARNRPTDPTLASGDAITRAITSPPVRALLAAWTRGPIRWRLAFPQGHKRAVVWRVARDVAAIAPELVNDPSQTTWDVLVDDKLASLELVPRRAADPRFAWRVADVPASSHPTVAAALAFVGEARATDRVWDPFAGSAAELVERALLGPYRSLVGTDLSEDALAAARKNLDAAKLTATLTRADARTHAAGPVDLIITNPPLGSRVRLDAVTLLVDSLPNFVKQLAPGGRIVWITPATRKTAAVAEALGLKRTRWMPVDLGGVRGQLERWDRA